MKNSILLTTLLLFTPLIAQASDSIVLAKKITFSEHSDVRSKVKDECKLETKIPHFISKYAGKKVKLVDDTKGAKKVLNVEINDVHAPGGGAWSGPKSVSVSGELIENGKVIATFTGSRYSTGGMWGGVKGTCSIVGRCAKAIGKDISKWLKKPVDGASLGDG